MVPLYVFVEGNDDERFFKTYFSTQSVNFIQYAHMKNKEVCNYLRVIKRSSPYLFIADSDRKQPSKKAQKICDIYKECEVANVVIVNLEIESWYMAGMSSELATRMKVKRPNDTNSFSKEQFNDIIPKKLSRIDFMLEILKQFDFDDAKNKNESFNLFSNKISR